MGIPMKRPFLGSQFSIVLSFLLVCFAVPYFCDVAFCEELDGTPPSQAALIDGETIDPWEGDTLFASLDWGTTGDLRLLLTSHGLPSLCLSKLAVSEVQASRLRGHALRHFHDKLSSLPQITFA